MKKTKKKRGSPSLTQNVIRKSCTAIRHGGSIRSAAGYAGIHYRTFYDWLAQGRRDERDEVDSRYRDLVDAVRKTQGERDDKLTDIVMRAAKNDWRAAKFALEHRARHSWNKDVEPDPEMDDLDISDQKVIDPHADLSGQILARFRAAQGEGKS